MELKKELGLFGVFCLSTGGMLAGLFILPGLAYEQAGPAVLISYFIAGFLALLGLLSQAELISAMPKAGGTYFYVMRAMGPGVGVVYGLITWLSISLKSAYELVYLAIFIIVLLGPVVEVGLPKEVLAVAVTLLFVGVNLLGAKDASRVQALLVLALIALLAWFCWAGATCPEAEAHRMDGITERGWGTIFATAGFVFVSFGGLLKVASIAEEVKDPGRVVPLGMILSLLVVVLLSLLVVLVTVAVLGDKLSGSETPVSDAAAVFFGKWGKTIFGAAAALAVIGAANAGIMAASRHPLALARDQMLPGFLGKINRRFGTPHWSVLLTGLIILLVMFVNIKVLVKAASSVLILTYVFAAVAVLVLRESRVQNYRPSFRSPLYPWVQIVGALGFMALLYEIGLEAMLACCGMVVIGFCVYWFYGRKQVSREYALLHLIERLTARELTSHSLETELKDIIHERDEVLKDRFDRLVENCAVLDIEEAIGAEDFFRRAAETLTEDLQLDSEVLAEQFIARERESSTVLSEFMAIPHVVVPGEKHFSMLLARCREGVVFSTERKSVHAVFMLVGTKDERAFHLRALAAICQIVQDTAFDQHWLLAKSPASLRDIILLGERRREDQ